MSVTFDFKIIGQTKIPGISLIEAQNEEAFNFITDEEALAILPDGSAPVFNTSLENFIEDAEQAQLCCVYA